jgi:predicted transcriptional regulator
MAGGGVMAADQQAETGATTLGPLEAEVMALLWRAGGALTVRQTAERLNADRGAGLAYTTVMTVLTRLADKGVLARTRVGRSFAYTPVAADTAHGDAALARFVERVEMDPALRSRLRRLMEQPR